jgi:hypothetical protein
MEGDYKRNHYVPVWYQKGFLCPTVPDRELHYLDLKPQIFKDGKGTLRTKRSLRRQGPKKCFYEDDLYTTFISGRRSTDIEKIFFGEMDRLAPSAVAHFNNFDHTKAGTHDAFRVLLEHLCTQKLRTPKGLSWLRKEVETQDKFILLTQLQLWKKLFAAIWTECVWLVADASLSPTKFIISDHPVTIYNRDCRPLCADCVFPNDPDIRLNGSHTIFPLSANKVLLLTNLSWARNPYQSATKLRPNPRFERDAMFFILDIQTKRELSEQEVREINYIIKRRAHRYIAAGQEEWLYPEKHIKVSDWNKFGNGYLCMPDPRSMSLMGETLLRYKDGRADAFDPYGRKPWQQGYSSNNPPSETDTFWNFQGEFARLFGPKRRGRSYSFSRLDNEIDSDEYHQHNLALEKFRRLKRR